MRYPEFLPKQGTIGLVAPSFGCATEPYQSAFQNAIKTWKAQGFQIVEGPNCRVSAGIGISNTPALCGEELNTAYASLESDVLFSCGGGELMCEVIPYMDFEAMKAAKPKWFQGYSDNTNFTYLSTTILDTAAVYGPCAPSFGMSPWHPCLEDSMEFLKGKKLTFQGYPSWEKESLKDEEHPLVPYHTTEETKYMVYVPKGEKASIIQPGEEVEMSVEGRLVGGCMDCLGTLLGTEFDHTKEFIKRYEKDGILWFLEACDLNVMGIRRTIWQMKHAGWFEHAKGFLIGRPMHFDEGFLGLDQYHAVVDLLQELQVPMIMDVDFGHLPPAIPMVSGAYAKATLMRGKFEITYDLR